MKDKCLLLLFFFVAGCSNRPYTGDHLLGAREFVLDSYQIQGGKISILKYEGQQIEPLSKEALEEYEDVIQDGDILTIRLFHPERHAELGHLHAFEHFAIQNGVVDLPIVHSVKLGGLTLPEAKSKLEEVFAQEIKGVQIFLSYKERLENKVQIAGLTALSTVPVNGKLRLFEVLSLAKVPSNANLFKSYLVRNDQLLSVDFEKLVKEGDMSQNVVVHPKDKIYIASQDASNVFVMGEVKKEGALPLLGGTMSIKEALAKAGGIGFTGDKAYIQVIRGNLTKPRIYTLTWRHILELPNDALLLVPGDIVYVAANPISQWNRFINQLFPSFTMYEFFNKGISGVIID